MDLVIIIPAQDTNQYHKDGDLAPFGDTTLLEWKISQCKEIISNNKIYISSDSELIKEISIQEDIGFIHRDKGMEYSDIIYSTLSSVNAEFILWTNPTSPFIGYNDYSKMINEVSLDNSISSLVSIYEKHDYVYYNNKRLNFYNKFTNRNTIKPIQIMTNGCYIIKKEKAIQLQSLYDDSPSFYKLDYLSSIEIKDFMTYSISNELISSYFKRELDV